MVKSVNFLKYGVMKNFRRIPGVDTNHLSSELQIYKGIPLSLMKGINSMEMERTIMWVIERNLLQVQVEPEIFPDLVSIFTLQKRQTPIHSSKHKERNQGRC